MINECLNSDKREINNLSLNTSFRDVRDLGQFQGHDDTGKMKLEIGSLSNSTCV